MRVVKDILDILERDARTTPEQIAVMLDLPVDEIRQTIEQLERDRVILKYKTVVNRAKIDDEPVIALIEVKVAPQREVGFGAVAERIYRYPEARSVYLVSGAYDLSVQVVGKTMKDVADFVARKLSPIDGVQSTVTHFLLQRYKEDGDVLGDQEEFERLPVTP